MGASARTHARRTHDPVLLHGWLGHELDPPSCYQSSWLQPLGHFHQPRGGAYASFAHSYSTPLLGLCECLFWQPVHTHTHAHSQPSSRRRMSAGFTDKAQPRRSLGVPSAFVLFQEAQPTRIRVSRYSW